MTEFPPLTHVALTVRDLSVSAPWYEALFDSEPVIDEDTDPDLHHTVYLVGGGALIGLHQHGTTAPARRDGRRSEPHQGRHRRLRPELPRPRRDRAGALRTSRCVTPSA